MFELPKSSRIEGLELFGTLNPSKFESHKNSPRGPQKNRFKISLSRNFVLSKFGSQNSVKNANLPNDAEFVSNQTTHFGD